MHCSRSVGHSVSHHLIFLQWMNMGPNTKTDPLSPTHTSAWCHLLEPVALEKVLLGFHLTLGPCTQSSQPYWRGRMIARVLFVCLFFLTCRNRYSSGPFGGNKWASNNGKGISPSVGKFMSNPSLIQAPHVPIETCTWLRSEPES